MLKYEHLNLRYWIILLIISYLGVIFFVNNGLYLSIILLFILEGLFCIFLLFRGKSITINFKEKSMEYRTLFKKRILKFEDVYYFKKTLFRYKVYSYDRKVIFKISRLHASYFNTKNFKFDYFFYSGFDLNLFNNDLIDIYNRKFKGEFYKSLFATINIILLTINGMLLFLLESWVLYGSNIAFIDLTSKLIILILLLVLLRITKSKKVRKIYNTVNILLILPILFVNVFSFALGGTSTTTDFNNYLKFDREIEENYSYTLDFFPKDIKEKEVINYYYFYETPFDIIYEINLEIRVDNEKFNNLINDFKNKYDVTEKVAYYNDDYCEIIVEDYMSFQDGYTSYGSIKKLIYNQKENILMYEYLYVKDPINYSDIYYFDRFEIEIDDYKNYYIS